MPGRFYSLIIPLYNRPQEIDELLASLAQQTYKHFEVIVVEDGSTLPAEAEVNAHRRELNLRYYTKPNGGPGPARNHGAQFAQGEYLIFLDSDCIIPQQYLAEVEAGLDAEELDGFGGPDAAHPSFSPIQKAISNSMTSWLTTGGIRGGKKRVGTYHPRSFNMGIRRKVFGDSGGYSPMRFGEDLDLSMRMAAAGCKLGLIEGAFVYHKRRTSFRKFYKQIFNSGIARINLYKRHPSTLKLVHFVPLGFVVYTAGALICLLAGWWFPIALAGLYLLLILAGSLLKGDGLQVAMLSASAAVVQHTAYGLGMLKAIWIRLILGEGEFAAYERNFYK